MKKYMYQILILCCVLQQSRAEDVTIYTKDFAPFSLNGDGYAIDFATRMLKNIYGQAVNIDVQVVSGNQAIFDNVLNNTDTLDNFTIGTAGISITSDREAVLDFLPPFFQSGFQVLTHSETSLNAVAKKVVRNFGIAFGLILLAVFVIVYTIAPIAWFFEMGFSGDKIPIFINWNSRKDIEPIECCGYVFECITPRIRRMFMEFGHALIWTLYTMCGVETGYPNSKGARIIHASLKGLKILIFTISLAVFSAVAVTSTQTNSIKGFNDLEGTTVCTVTGSTSENYLELNNIGFGILKADNLEEMFQNFWAQRCDAVVYDFPALQSAIVEQEKAGGGADAVIVGAIFNREYYGIATKPGNPNFETLKQAVISLNNDNNAIVAMESKWFKHTAGVKGDDKVDWPVALFVVPSVMGIGLLILAIIWLYRNYDKKNIDYIKMRKEMANRDYVPELRDLIELEGGNDSILMGQDETIDRWLTPMIMRILRVVYELELRWKGRDIHEVERDSLPRDVNRTFYGEQAPTTAEDEKLARQLRAMEMHNI